MEGHTPVSENPHTEYSLTENIQGGGEREGECGEDAEAEGGPAGPAHPSVPGPDRGPHPAPGPVGAGQGQTSQPHRVPGRLPAEEQGPVRGARLNRFRPVCSQVFSFLT
uniref:Uncharacterized protein n=2 Tax=Tetraodon nigroviridis TaxID=99883 RepID=H3CB71_TETNG